MADNERIENNNQGGANGPYVSPPRRVIDDDQLKKMMNANKVSLYDRYKGQLVTMILIVVNVLVFIIEFVNSNFNFNISTQVLVDMGAMYAPFVKSITDIYRFVTPMFLHVDFMHIAFNMVALYSVGVMLERVLGKGSYLLLYFVSGITGNAVSYIADVYFSTTLTVSAGASTSVFGLFVATALLGILFKGNNNYIRQFSKGVIAVIAVNVVYTFMVPGISISGHLGGALGGLIAMLMIPSKNLKVPNLVRIVVALAWAGALIFLLAHEGIVAF